MKYAVLHKDIQKCEYSTREKGIVMKAITAKQARRMVEESLGKVEPISSNPKAEMQMEHFESELQNAIINQNTSFEIHFKDDFQKEAIIEIVNRGFSIWKVYLFKDYSRYEVALSYDFVNVSKEVAGINYKFYF